MAHSSPAPRVRRLFVCLCLALSLCFGAPEAAQAQASSRASYASEYAEVELLSESAQPAPGQTWTMAFVIRPKAGWHSYWENPGGAGQPVQLLWQLPEGAKASPLRYPAPKTLKVSGIVNHVVDAPAILLTDIQLPPGLKPGTSFVISVRAQYLVCDDKLCVPQSAALARTLTVGQGQADPALTDIFAQARAALPIAPMWPVRYTQSGEEIRMAISAIPYQDIRSVHVFAVDPERLDPDAPQRFAWVQGELHVAMRAQSPRPRDPFPLVLRLEAAAGGPAQSFALEAAPGPVPPLPAETQLERKNGQLFLTSVLLAIVGGLLLNLMPCVFPILGLKALHLAQAGHEEKAARQEAWAYSAGTVLTCTALGALLLLLRAGGAQMGWAFQLQSPVVIALLLFLMLAIALNLSGFYALRFSFSGGQALSEKGGALGAFWTGALAAFVATPCTGPFMGVALGAALLLPWAAALGVFAGLGLGIALPFLAIAYSPTLRRRLPKPGPWMERLRRLMSIPMWLTAAALLWVLHRQAGLHAMLWALASSCVLILLLWRLGGLQNKSRPTGGIVALSAALVVALPVALVLLPPSAPTATPNSRAQLLDATPFSQARLQALRAEKRPVFLYFTADWCITCKVNERGAMSNEAVAAHFRSAAIVTLVGDWTRGDAEIGRFLASHGRAGVPLYLYYAPNGQVQILPQILTPADLLALGARE